MVKKIASISVLALTTALMGAGAMAHTGKWLADGSGNKVVDGSGKCVTVSSGVNIEACDPPKPAPKPEPVVVKEPAKPVYVPAAPKPVLVKVTDTFSLSGDASFATNSAELTAGGMEVLDKMVADLSKVELTSLVLTGHADSRGKDSYNMALSEKRAKSVQNYLVSKGVNPAMISAYGRGETEPVASNDTVEGRAKNRRVDIAVTANKTVYK